ncbi:MAG TPA: DUF3754 domain-containing protein [Gemmataceae bacterium]|nr:DUF3754 domain-containing protein [Gemmataceae bacterium]
MAAHLDREHFIPLRVSDLTDFLATGRGAKTDPRPLSSEGQASLRQLADGLVDHYHRGFNARLRHIKDAYAPFDPDADTLPLTQPTDEERDRALERLFREVKGLLEKANYKELSRLEALEVMKGASYWGVELDVDWTVFDHLEMYYRGDSTGTRSLRRWWKLWWKEEVTVAEFNRLVIILKQRPHRRLGAVADTKSVFVKVFKDLPKCDLEMVLPGTKILLTKLDLGMIVYPLASGFGILLYKVLADVIGFRDFLSLGLSVTLSWSLAALFLGYGYKSYVSYTTKKTSYALQLTQSLYYQVIGTNAGVFARLVDEAEEQEVREALLAYFFLWQRGGGRAMTARELDDRIEEDLDQRLGIKVDFEIADALDKLDTLGLVRREGEGYKAVSITEALAILGGSAKPSVEGKPKAGPQPERWELLDRLAGR